MASSNIFAQYIQPVRSVQDYSNELARGDFIEGQNALQQSTLRQQQRAEAAAAQRSNALRQLLAGATDEDTVIQRLLGSGDMEFVTQGQALDKSRQDRAKIGADVGKAKADATKTTGEATDAALKRYQGMLAYIDTPQGAARWLQAQYQDPATGQLLQGIRPFEEAVQGIPQDPQAFQQWRQQAGIGMEKVAQFAKEREIAAANNATTQRGQDISAATQRRGQDISAATAAAGRAQADRHFNAAQATKSDKISPAQEKADIEKAKAGRQGEQMLSAIEEARSLLGKKPTASGVGAMVDKAGRAVGVTSDSAKTAAQLETLSGWMVANVPRMEGPQSNFDVENYKIMAAKVGDRTVPVDERLAALSTLESLHRKYADINGTPLSASPSRVIDTTAGVPSDIADIMKKYGK